MAGFLSFLASQLSSQGAVATATIASAHPVLRDGNREAQQYRARVEKESLADLVSVWKTLSRREELRHRFGIDRETGEVTLPPLPDSSEFSLREVYHLLESRVRQEYVTVCSHFEELLASYCTVIVDPVGGDILDGLLVRHDVCMKYGLSSSPFVEHYRSHKEKYHEFFRLRNECETKGGTKRERRLCMKLAAELAYIRHKEGVCFRHEQSSSLVDVAFYSSLAAACGDVLYKGSIFLGLF